MKLFEIKPLLQDMGRNKVKQDKFSFQYNKVKFEVIVLIERAPFELLFGVVDHNFSFALKLAQGTVLCVSPICTPRRSFVKPYRKIGSAVIHLDRHRAFYGVNAMKSLLTQG